MIWLDQEHPEINKISMSRERAEHLVNDLVIAAYEYRGLMSFATRKTMNEQREKVINALMGKEK